MWLFVYCVMYTDINLINYHEKCRSIPNLHYQTCKDLLDITDTNKNRAWCIKL